METELHIESIANTLYMPIAVDYDTTEKESTKKETQNMQKNKKNIKTTQNNHERQQETQTTDHARETLIQEKLAILECTGMGIYGIDFNGVCTFINSAALTMLGFEEKEVIGMNMHKLIHHHYPDGRVYEYSDCPLYEIYHSGSNAYTADDVVWKKDGMPLAIAVKANPIRIGGKFAGTVISFTDITKRKEQEARKDDFISIASHELKTPITTIKAFTQLLSKYYSGENNRRASLYLSKMDTQIDKLTRLVQDLLDVTKIKEGKLVYDQENFSLENMIRETIDEVQMTTSSHTIVYDASEDTLVYGDRYRINQVMTNLITNAIKYSPASEKVIVTSKPNGKMVNISIQDFGIGIPDEERKFVFERFYRVGGKARESFPGLGVGLYISYEIVKRHGGTMGVESTHGNGSRFFFTLPKSFI